MRDERESGGPGPFSSGRAIGIGRGARLWAAAAGFPILLAGCGSDSGRAQPEPYTTPVLVSDTLRFSAIESSGWHTCGVALDGTTWCWGKNEYGELGTSAELSTCDIPGVEIVDCTSTPQRVAGVPALVSLALSLNRTCGLTEDGTAFCWGFGLGGQLGDGLETNSASPAPVTGGLELATIRSSLDNMATCGLTVAGEGWCWGVDAPNLFGNGSTADNFGSAVPLQVDWGRNFEGIDLGQMHGCGVEADGRTWCWGQNWYGQLGIGSVGADGGPMQSNLAVPVSGGHVFREVVTGSDRTCALDDAGEAWCWGAGSTAHEGIPAAVGGGHVFVELASGYQHTCGLTVGGEVWCWGVNLAGWLGDGTTADSDTPVRVQAPVSFARLAHRPGCALTAEGQAWCWGGDNAFGELGRRSPYAR